MYAYYPQEPTSPTDMYPPNQYIVDHVQQQSYAPYNQLVQPFCQSINQATPIPNEPQPKHVKVEILNK